MFNLYSAVAAGMASKAIRPMTTDEKRRDSLFNIILNSLVDTARFVTDDLLQTICYRRSVTDDLLQTICYRRSVTDDLLQTICYQIDGPYTGLKTQKHLLEKRFQKALKSNANYTVFQLKG